MRLTTALLAKRKVSSVLPQGYTRLAYIEATTKTPVDTGIRSSLGIKIQTEMRLTDLKDGNNCTSGAAYSSGHYLFVGRTGNYLVAYFTEDTSGNGRLRIPIDDLFHTYITENGCQQIDDVISTNRISTMPSRLNLVIFHSSNDWGGTNWAGTIQMKYFTIWEYGNLVRNYVPALRDSDQTPGLWETVTQQFVTNAGFVAGYD